MHSSICQCQAAQAALLYLPASKLSSRSSLGVALLLSLCVSRRQQLCRRPPAACSSPAEGMLQVTAK